MAIRKVHSDTARAARKIAREDLGIKDPKLRPATGGEQLTALKEAGFDLQQVRDAVVVEDRANGREYLLGIDLDPTHSRHLNAESGVLTWGGLIPVIGAPVVAAFAIKDLIQGGVPALKAKLAGDATNPRDRALLRMGVKHLGLASFSMASLGVANAAYAAKAGPGAETAKAVYDAAKVAKKGVMAAEVIIGAKDISDAREKGSGVVGVGKAIASGISGILKSVVTGLQSLAGVHHPEQHHKEDARLIFATERKLGGEALGPGDAPTLKKTRTEPSTGPPADVMAANAVPDDVQ